jgi:hypothetical protein
MRISRTSAFATGAVVALVLGSGTAVAATGGNFILGKSNNAGRVTTLSNPNGSALNLKSKAGTPSIRVNTGAKVRRLNADKIDGLSSGAFARAKGKTGYFEVDASLSTEDTDSNGVDDLFIAYATCPPGTQRTGGGGIDFTLTGLMWANTPVEGHGWAVAVSTDNVEVEAATDVLASVVCYNPRGAVPGATARTAAPELPASVAERLVEKGARLTAGR